eukprot:PLAT6297.3.p1 GENE.PLAT6297.3~~PLAT6297.3.p1  ORF type:complete len:228 (-),score=64.04 PLAT6297.3:577-1161(-)
MGYTAHVPDSMLISFLADIVGKRDAADEEVASDGSLSDEDSMDAGYATPLVLQEDEQVDDDSGSDSDGSAFLMARFVPSVTARRIDKEAKPAEAKPLKKKRVVRKRKTDSSKTPARTPPRACARRDVRAKKSRPRSAPVAVRVLRRRPLHEVEGNVTPDKRPATARPATAPPAARLRTGSSCKCLRCSCRGQTD